MAAYNIANQAGALVRAALNTVIGKLQRNYFGATDPASAGESTAGMWWVDSSGTFPRLRIRNGSDNGWISILDLNPSTLYTTLFERVKILTDLSGGVELNITTTRLAFAPTEGVQTITADSTGMRTRGDLRPWVGGAGNIGLSTARYAGAFLVNAPNVSSDFRLKENIADYTDTDLAAARLIKAQTFRLTATDTPSSGYVAQQIIYAFELAGLEPDAAERRAVDLGLLEMGEDGMWGVRYELVNALRIQALLH